MLQRSICRAKLLIQIFCTLKSVTLLLRNLIELEYIQVSSNTRTKISAVKRKGDHPSFSQQRSNTNAPKARNDGQGSSNKKKPKKSNKGKGKQAHFVESEPAPTPFSLAASAVRPMIALQPSRAGPSTTTVASINPNRVTYSTVATPTVIHWRS